jgi:transcriptional regulator with XRE-family HTH domain
LHDYLSRTTINEKGEKVPRKRTKSSALTEHGIERLGKSLKEKREDLGMTQEAFTDWIEAEGARLGILGARLSVGAIQNWEVTRIASCPDLGNMRLLAAVFGLDTDSFVTYLNGDWDSISEFTKDPDYRKQGQPNLSPNLAAEIFRNADIRIKAPIIVGELQALFARASEDQAIAEREVSEEDVEGYLASASKDTQKRFYRFLQERLIGA